MKGNQFKHVEVFGLEDVANLDDYSKETPKDTDLQEDSSSFVKDITSLMPDMSKVIAAVVNVTPLANHLEKTSKQDLLDAMDIEEEDTSKTSKRHNIEVE